MGVRIPDINQVSISGRLTRDPELKYTGSNRAYCKVSIAYSRKYKTKEGEKREESTFIDGTLWDRSAEWAAELGKGAAVIAEGRLRQSEWEDRETGQKRTRIEIAITRLMPLEWREDSAKETQPEAPQAAAPDDDIPF